MIIWLASYPKSGNTLLRSILGAYFFSEDGNFDFEHLYKIGQFPSFFKVKFQYDANDFPLLRLPFHKKRIFLKNYFWVMSVLNKMDYEVSILQKRIKNKKYNLYIDNKTNTNISLDQKTKTLYN